MHSLKPFRRRILFVALAVLLGSLAACGGGGSAATDSTGSATSGGSTGSASTSGTSQAAAPAPVASAAPVGSASSSPATAPTNTALNITAAVGTDHTLSAAATASLAGLSDPSGNATPIARSAQGRTFYIDSSNGADTNDGHAAAGATGSGAAGGSSGPWRTLARLMQSDLAAGDNVELACRSVWQETLHLPASGTQSQPIVVSGPAAGCTTPPTIDGSVALPPSAWVPYQGNIYRAALSAPPLQVFASTGTFTQAHYPNRGAIASDPTSPYLSLASDTSAAKLNGADVTVLTTGPDLQLPAGATLAAGTRVRVRTNNYIIDESTVAAFDGTHITLASALTYPASAGWGYYLFGQLWMLDSAGEWNFDADAKQLYVWMPDSAAPASPVTVSTLAVGVDLQGRGHVRVDGLIIRKVGLGVDLRSTTDVQLQNASIEDVANVGVDAAGSTQDVIAGNRVSRTGTDAITGWGGAMSPLLPDSTHLTVQNNVVLGSGVLMQGEQVLSLPRRSLAAIFPGTNSSAAGNLVVDAGYIGILVEPQTTVQGNFVYGACSVQDDCGAIYTGGDHNGSQIRANTVVHSRGSLPGQPLTQRGTSAQGIYVDDQGADIVVDGNTVIDADFGILMHNATRNTVTGNRLYGNRAGQLWMQEDTNARDPAGDMSANVIQGNQFASISPRAPAYLLTTRFASTSAFGQFAANRFNDNASPVIAAVSTAAGTGLYSMATWQGSVGVGSTQPVDAQGSAVSTLGYAWYSIAGTNLIANSGLQVDSSGWSSWNQTAPAGQMIRESCPAGICLRYVAGGSSGVLSSPGFAIHQGSWYRLTVDVATETENQTVPLIVRIRGADYGSVADRNLAFVGHRAWQRYTAVFQAKRTVDPAISGDLKARVDIDGILAGQSVSMAGLELVPITPSVAAQTSAVFVNVGLAPLTLTCPSALSQAGLCTKMAGLADDQPIAWPLTVAPYSAAVVYGLDTTLLDSDRDGIPDFQDLCPASTPGGAVNASGCAFVPH